MSEEDEGKAIWEKWMEELTPPYTVSYNPAGILYARDRITELQAVADAAKVVSNEKDILSTHLGGPVSMDALMQSIRVMQDAIKGVAE